MATILLETVIYAPLERCFDLARSIDLHQESMAHTKERAVAGTTKGLISLGETVTWEAVHFGIRQRLSTKITLLDKPNHFRDEQVRGAFQTMVHDHYFESVGDHVVMKDVFVFDSPAGIVGRIFNRLILIRYMTKLLTTRNAVIKAIAEK